LKALEGTFVIDGMIEGPLLDARHEHALRDWIARVAQRGLSFALELESGSFSVLADSAPVAMDKIGDAPADAATNALRELLDTLPRPMRTKVFSTLRSMQYGKNTELQTIYTISSAGTVQTHQRAVETQTSPPMMCMPRQGLMRRFGMGAIVAMLALLVSALFVDYPSAGRKLLGSLRTADAEGITVEAGPFAQYIKIESKRMSKMGLLTLTLRRGERFPLSDGDYQSLLAGASVPQRLAVEAIARGYVRCEVFDCGGAFATSSLQRISDLRGNEKIDIAIPVPRDKRVSRVALVY
jgi:hypothetical protein